MPNLKFCLWGKTLLFIFVTVIVLEGCQDQSQQLPRESFNLEEAESNPSIVGRWQLSEVIEDGVIIIDMNNEEKMINSLMSLSRKQSNKISESDSLKLFRYLAFLKDNSDDYYLHFYESGKAGTWGIRSGKIKGGVVTIFEDSLVKYELEGHYEKDEDKLRINMPDHNYPIKIGGGFNWFRFKDQLRLYPNFFQNKNTYRTYYLKK